MSDAATQEKILPEMSQDAASADWEPPMPPTDLVFDDGEPLESNRHRVAMNALIRSMLVAFADRDDYFAGGNMFIYFSSEQVRNRDFRGPDFFVVLNVDNQREREGWVVWEENGRYPDAIVELMSASTAKVDITTKKEIYEQTFRTPDYFVFDPFDANSLRGWHLDENQSYQELVPNDRRWLWSQRLGLWLGTWEGSIDGISAFWLRFYDRDGNLVLLPEEAEHQRAEAEYQRAETERQRAETAEQQVEQARRQGAIRQLMRLLTARFGEVSSEVETSLQTWTDDRLENAIDMALSVNSIEQFLDRSVHK
ncbi:MAG: Uma2 family endonuclease [Geitlerinemataceae cyanobacterium]